MAESVQNQTNIANSLTSTVTSRFSSAEWFDFVQTTKIAIIGAGGIGSWLTLFMSRLNPASIFLMDDDFVEMKNLAGQMYSSKNSGLLKVEAMAGNVMEFSAYTNLSILSSRFVESTKPAPIMMCGVDNMATRRIAFEAWASMVKEMNNPMQKEECLFIDGRLSAENLQIFCISGTDDYYMDEYRKDWLFSDKEADKTPCSYKQTTYCASLIGSLMTNLFINWCTNKNNPTIPRSVPFMTEYAADQIYLKTVV